MIKALLLIFEPGMTWDKIVLAKRSVSFVLFAYLLPLIILSIAGELFGLLYWGRHQEIVGEMRRISTNMAIYYGSAQFVMSLALVFGGAKLLKSFAGTFHTRHSYGQCFILVAYTLGPLFLVRLLDAFPFMNPWATFAIGIILSVAVLYNGIPRMLEPDPPHAFGLYITSAMLLIIIGGLGRFLTTLVLDGKLNLH